MRVFILALSVFGILASANVAKAGPSMTDRDLLASADPATFVHEATQETEDLVIPSQRPAPASAAATNPMTTVRPVVAAGVAFTITAVVQVD